MLGKVRDVPLGNVQPGGESWSEDEILFVHPTLPGFLTDTEPEAPYLRVPVAAVLSVHETGNPRVTLMVRPTHGLRMGGLYDVHAPNPANGQFLAWNAVSGRYELTNATPAAPTGWIMVSTNAGAEAFPYAFILADTAGADVEIRLPVASAGTGSVVGVRKMADANFLYVAAQPGEAVQGFGTVGVVRAGSVIEAVSDGTTNWWLR